MRLFSIVVLVAFSTSADAHRLDDWGGGPKSISLDDIVQVPLLRGPCGDLRPHVAVSIGDEDYLFRLDTSGTGVLASKSVIEDAGGEVKVKNKSFWKSFGRNDDHEAFRMGGKKKVGSIDEIVVGGLTLHDVSVIAKGDRTASGVLPSCPASVSGVLGLESIDAAVAILPSEGVVRFAPADRGGELITALSGTVLSTQTIDSTVFKYGAKLYDRSYRQAVEITVGSAPEPSLAVFTTTARLSSVFHVVTGIEPFSVADSERAQVQVAVGGLGVKTVWANFSSLAEVLPADVMASRPTVVLGHHFLRDYDVVLDPAGAQIGLKRASGQKAQSSLAWMIDNAYAALAAPAEPAEGDEEADPAEKKKERASDLSELAAMLLEKGDLEKAIQHYEEAASLQPDACGSWTDAATGYAAAMRFDAALVAARQASGLYTDWQGLSDDEKSEIEALEGEEAEASAVTPQSSGCYVVYGAEAMAALATGDGEAAVELYAGHSDLDHQLPGVAGIAAWAAGDTVVANGALRQAIKLGSAAGDSRALAIYRLALARIHAEAGVEGDDSDGASRSATLAVSLWEREAQLLGNDPLAVEDYARYLDGIGTTEQTNARLEALSQRLIFPAAVHGELASRGVGEVQTATALYDQEIAYGSPIGVLLAQKAWTVLKSGDLEGAALMANQALESHPSLPYAWLVLSEVEAAAGNVDAAKAHAAKARGLGVGHIGFHRAGDGAADIGE